jgi:hypothetical protein
MVNLSSVTHTYVWGTPNEKAYYINGGDKN